MRIPITEISNNELNSNTLVAMYLRQFGTSSVYTMPGPGRWFNTNYFFTFGSNAVGFEGILSNKYRWISLTERQYEAFEAIDSAMY